MAKIKQTLRNMHNRLSVFIDFVFGREDNTEEQVPSTQRNQYFT